MAFPLYRRDHWYAGHGGHWALEVLQTPGAVSVRNYLHK